MIDRQRVRAVSMVALILISMIAPFGLASWFTAIGTASAAGGCQPISGPTVITQSGCYALTGGVQDSPNETFIDIQASDVILDGGGYTIDSVSDFNTIGVYVNGSKTNRLTNVTVRNIVVSHWEKGVYFAYADDGSFENVTASDSGHGGIYFRGANGVQMHDITTFDHPYDPGILVVDSYNVSMENLDSSADDVGVRITSGHGVTVSNSSFYKVDSGVKLSDSGGTLVENSTFSHSGMIYLTNSNGTANRFIDNTGYGDMYDGYCGGFWVQYADGDFFANNTLTGCSYGARVQDSDAVTFENNTIDISHTYSNTDNFGIRLSGGGNHTLTNNTILNAGSPGKDEQGIDLGGTIHATLSGNTLAGSPVNLRVRGSEWRTVDHDIDSTNTVEGRPIYYYVNGSAGSVTVPTDAGYVGLVGTTDATVADISFPANNEENIYLWNADGTEIRNVTASGSRSAVWADYDSNDLVVEDSTFDHAGGIYLSKSVRAYVANTTINYGIGNGVTLYQASDTTIENVTVRNVDDHGVMVKGGSNDVTIANSTFESNDRTVIYSYQNVGLTVTDNVIENNGGSAFLDSGQHMTDATIRGNVIANNDGLGVRFDNYATNITVADNEIYGNTNEGLVFDYDSRNVQVVDNNISDNGGYGIDLGGNGNYATFVGNTISGHSLGLDLSSSFGNLSVYDNYFNNTQNIDIPDPTGLTNATWNTTNTSDYNVVGGPYTGGNFWAAPDGNGSSQTCADANLDGFCDTPYNVTTGHNDSLPLTTPPPNRPPYVTDDHFTTTIGETLTIDAPGVFANDFDAEGDAYSIEATYSLGNGSAAVTSDGRITYTPHPDFTGTDYFYYKVVDEAGKTSRYATVLIDVVEDTNRAPTASADQYTTFEDESLTVSAPGVLANDVDPDNDSVYIAAIGSSPTHGNLSNIVGGGFTYTPDPGYNGTDSFTYRIADGELYSGLVTVTLDVLPDSNRPPEAHADQYTTFEDEPLTVSAPGMLANDVDPDNDSVYIAAIGSSPTHGNLSNIVGGGFTYTPDTGYNGTDSFTYRVADGVLYSEFVTATVVVEAGTGNTATALPDEFSTTEGQNLTVGAPGVLSNDYDPNGDPLHIVAIGTSPSHGNLSNIVGGGFTYAPDPGFNGTDSFTYRVADGNGTQSGFVTVTLAVQADPNRNPVVSADQYTTFEDESLTVSAPGVLANDVDPDNDSVYIAAIGSSPTHGNLSNIVGGGFTYTPDTGYNGTDSFTYRIADGEQYSGFVTVTLDVLPDPNRAPEAHADQYTTFAGQNLTISGPGVLANDVDPDNDSVYIAAIGSSPTHGSLSNIVGGGFTYAPDPGYNGTDSFTYRIADGELYSGFVTVTLDVLPDSNRAPTGIDDTITVIENGSMTVPEPGVFVNDVDPDGDSLGVNGTSAPGDGSVVVASNGSTTYTPDAGFVGLDHFSYVVEDEHGTQSDSVAVTVVVVNESIYSPADVAVSRSSLDLGNATIGDSVAKTVVVANVGVDPLNVSNVSITGANADEFSVSNGGHFDLASGEVETLTVTFVPTVAGSKSATLEIASNDTDEPTTNVSLVGNGLIPTEPTITVTPTSVDFGTVTTGANATANVTIQNIGESTLTFDDATIASATHGYFTIIGGNVSTPLARGESHNVTVEFAPTGGNLDSATLQIHSNDPDTPTESVSLSGIGRVPVPEVAVAPTSHDFGDVEDGSSASTNVTIENLGDADLEIQSVSIVDATLGGLSVGPFATPTTIAPNESVNVTATFAPTTAGSDSATLRIATNDTDEATVNVSLAGNGILGPEPEIRLVPTSYNFGTSDGSSLPFGSITIFNDGVAPLNWTGTALTGPDAGDFVISGNKSGIIAPNGGSATVSFYFDIYGATPGSKSANLVITSNDSDEGTLSVPLSVNFVPDPNAYVSPTSHDFGTVSAGDTATYNVSVTNDGGGTLTFDGVAATGDSAFQVVAGNGTTALGYGDSHEFTVEFAPTSQGATSSTLSVLTDDPDEPSIDVSVSGTGVYEPIVNVTPAIVNFGDVTTGTSENVTVTVQNDGQADLQVYDSYVSSEAFFPPFAVIAGNGSVVIPPGGSHDVTVRFGPSLAGKFSASLVVSNNDTYTSVPLAGTGVAPAPVIDVTPLEYDFGNVSIYETANASFTVANDGDAPLNVTGTSVLGPNASEFSVATATPVVLAPGDSTTIDLEFTPASTGAKVAGLAITSNDTTQTLVNVAPINATVVDNNRNPVAVADDYAITEGTTLTISAPGRLENDLDPNGDAIHAVAHTNPSHGTLVSSVTDGSFEYVPDPGFTGTDSFAYWIRDEHDAESGYAMVTIEVTPDPNRRPEAIDDTYSVYAGEWLNVSAQGVLENDRDPDGDTLDAPSYYYQGSNDLATFYGSGGFHYKADPWFTGTDTFTYWVDDGNETDHATVTIEVLPNPETNGNRVPVGVDDHYTIAAGEWLNVSGPGVLANDRDPDGDTFDAPSYFYQGSNELASFRRSGGFDYRADADFAGTDSFTYWVEDEHGEYSQATVTIEVVATNRPPTALDDHYAVLKGEWLNVSGPGVLANDYDVDNDTFDAPSYFYGGSGDLASFRRSGGFNYKPAQGFTGTDTFTYWVEDGDGESEYGTVSIEVVDPSGTKPVAVDDNFTVYEGEWLNVSGPGVLANDLDPNGDTVDAPSYFYGGGGDLASFRRSGGFEYKPAEGFTGTDTFTYWVDDGNESDHATVTIEVLPAPDKTGNRAPNATDDHYTVYEDEWLNVSGPGVLANDYDSDGDTFDAPSYFYSGSGDLASFRRSGGFEYKPAQGFTGTDTFTYWVEDEHGETAHATVTVEVLPDPNRRPEAIDDHYSVYAGEWLNVSGPGVLGNDRDPDGDTFDAPSYFYQGSNELASFRRSGGFDFRADADFAGTDSFTYWVEDEHGEYSHATVTVDVLPDPNRAPQTVPDHYVVLQGETLTVSGPGVLANDYDPDGDTFDAPSYFYSGSGDLATFQRSGGFEYTPAAGFTGVDSFHYWTEDEHGNESDAGTVTITVVDGSVSGLADVAVARDSVDFGTVPAGRNRTETVEVANIGDQNLTVYGAKITGPNASAFDVIAGNATTVLGYGGTNDFTVRYAPTVGPADAILTVLTNDIDEPTVNVTLSGEGYDADAPTVNAIDVSGSYVDDSDPANGSVVYENETVEIEVDATDQFGSVSDVTITLDARSSGDRTSVAAGENGSTGNWTASIDFDSLSDGAYDVVVEATDDSGNSRTVVANDSVVVDRTAPSLSATVTRNASTANVTVRAPEEIRPGSLAVEVEDPDGNLTAVSMTDEGDHWNGTIALSKDGQYNITATAIDLAGNRGSDDATARFANASTDANNTITIQMQPSGLFVRFTTNRSVNNTFITMTESKVPVKPLVNGQAPVKFLDAVLGKKLTQNLSYAVVGIPVDTSLLKPGTDVDDVTIRHFNETTHQWTKVPTTIENVTVNGTTDQYWVATVTHFSTYGAVSTDTTPPSVTAMDPVDGHELAAGTTTKALRMDFEDALSGVDTDQITVVYDGSVVNGDPGTTITSSYVEYEATGLTDGSSHDLAVTVTDEAGNDVTETLSFTVGTANTGGGGSGGSGGSGGGGGSVPPPSILMDVADIDGGVLVTIQNGRAGATGRTSLSVGDDGVDFTQLDLAFARDAPEFTVELHPGGASPAGAPSLRGAEAFRFFEVNAAGITDADLDHANLRFTLDRSVLPDGASLRDVSVYRLHGGSWQRLETHRSGDSFTVTTPGFSTFAIAIDRPAFAVADLGADATTVDVGDTVAFTAEIHNDGAGDGRYEAALLIDGESVVTRTVGVDAGDSKTVTFERTFEQAGTYEVSVGDRSITVTVESVEATTSGSNATPSTTAGDGQPGFGSAVAILAVLAGALLALRRRD